MPSLYIYSAIYSNGIELFSIVIDDQELYLDLRQVAKNACRVRIIFLFGSVEQFQEGLQLFGDEIFNQDFGSIHLKQESIISLKSDHLHFSEKLSLAINKDQNYFLQCRVFKDNPINPNGIFDVMLIPQSIVTIVFEISENKVTDKNFAVQKYFDGFSYLGFALVDILKMNAIIEKNYENKNEIDLVFEFANSNLVDELFDAGILIITWGINPFSYPIYSCQSINDIEPILGNPFDFSGTYKIREDINNLSIIPGHKLKNWSTTNPETFPKIDIFGKGNLVTLQPYSLRDKKGQSIVPSFALYRSLVDSPVSEPLLNVNLLD